jgi:hypothetical protein
MDLSLQPNVQKKPSLQKWFQEKPFNQTSPKKGTQQKSKEAKEE